MYCRVFPTLGNEMKEPNLAQSFLGRDIVAIHDFSKAEIQYILDYAKKMVPVARGEKRATPLQGKILASLFFEPSTRTRLSFETAITRLGGRIIGITDKTGTGRTA